MVICKPGSVKPAMLNLKLGFTDIKKEEGVVHTNPFP